MIRFACSNCRRLISVDEKHSGKKGKCPKCGSGVVVPERSTIIEFSCGRCGHKISAPERQGGKKGACPKCKNPVVVPSIKKALAASDASITPAADEDIDRESPEAYEEPAGVDRHLIVMISAAAAVVVVALIMLVVVLRPSRPRPQQEVAYTRESPMIAPQADGVISLKADGGAKTTVKLLDPGAEPRTALRYKFQANRTEKMVMEISMAMAIEMGDQNLPETQMPVIRMTMTIDSKEVSPEGDLHYESELEQVEVLPKPGANPAMVHDMKQQMSSMQGLSGSGTITSRGFTKDAEIKFPPGIDPQQRQFMDNMKQSMDQISAPLPEEPVGRGARWQVTMPVETPAMKLTQIATYTLSEIQGDKVKFDVAIKQSAAPQEIDAPGAAPGVKVSLESFNSSGTGTVELQMTNLVPTSNMNTTTTTVVSADNLRIKTTMRMGLKIYPYREFPARLTGLELEPARTRQFASRRTCATNLSGLGKAMLIYCYDHEDKFPTASNWCDLLIENAALAHEGKGWKGSAISSVIFQLKGAGEGLCHYAMNKNVANLGISAVQPGVVLLFETHSGWNQVGGSDILTTDNHQGDGCNVLFTDSRVEFVRASQIPELRWK